MGNKFVTINSDGIVQEPYDEDNSNVPDGAIPITDDEFNLLSSGSFGDFEIINGELKENQKSLNNRYKKDRKEGYPSIGDQLDMIYWDSINNTAIWKDLIGSIKAKYPKTN